MNLSAGYAPITPTWVARNARGLTDLAAPPAAALLLLAPETTVTALASDGGLIVRSYTADNWGVDTLGCLFNRTDPSRSRHLMDQHRCRYCQHKENCPDRETYHSVNEDSGDGRSMVSALAPNCPVYRNREPGFALPRFAALHLPAAVIIQRFHIEVCALSKAQHPLAAWKAGNFNHRLKHGLSLPGCASIVHNDKVYYGPAQHLLNTDSSNNVCWGQANSIPIIHPLDVFNTFRNGSFNEDLLAYQNHGRAIGDIERHRASLNNNRHLLNTNSPTLDGWPFTKDQGHIVKRPNDSVSALLYVEASVHSTAWLQLRASGLPEHVLLYRKGGSDIPVPERDQASRPGGCFLPLASARLNNGEGLIGFVTPVLGNGRAYFIRRDESTLGQILGQVSPSEITLLP